LVNHSGVDALDGIHPSSIPSAGSLADVLLTSLDPSAVAAGRDIADAVRIDGATLSRSDLVGAATSVAERVAGAGVVAILATPTATTVLAVTGCLIAGVPFVPVPADVGAAERRHIVTDSGAVAWLGELPSEPEGLPHVPVRLHARSWHRYAEPPEDASAMVVYTSGTTGPPKGVVLSRRAIAADVDALAKAWAWTPDDTLVHGLPLFHVHGLILGLLGSLRIGNRFVHTGKPTPASYAAAAGSLYFGVPTVWSRVVGDVDAALALSSARLLVSGSAPLPVPVFDALVRLTGHAPVERYGSTESLITLSTLADGERRPGWVGLPLDGVQSRLVDDDGAPAAHDGETIGRLEVRGPMLFDGYLNRPDATSEVLGADGWYRTGDVAVIDDGGMHRIVGRESVDLIKSGGYRIGAGEIETVLLGHPDVDEVAVVGVADDDLGQRIVAFVVGSASPQALIDHVAQQLSVHKRPREVRIVDALPRNAMGKVLKKELAQWD
jgi:fatty acid CoA ligase FadD36